MAAAPNNKADNFTYDKPNLWKKRFPGCAGNKQSPIPLEYRTSVRVEGVPLIFNNYDVPLRLPLKAVNTGKTVRVDINATVDGTYPSIRGGSLKPSEVYIAKEFHFHWGRSSAAGSEHSVGGRKYDVEMHIVHRNSRFKTDEQALADPQGFAVLAVLIDETVDNSKFVKCIGFDQVYQSLPYITRAKTERAFTRTFTLRSMLGKLDTTKFFTYFGSKTKPPCSQAVTWFVFPDVHPIRSEHLRRFWALRDSRGHPLFKNFRPLQKPKHMVVSYYRGLI